MPLGNHSYVVHNAILCFQCMVWRATSTSQQWRLETGKLMCLHVLVLFSSDTKQCLVKVARHCLVHRCPGSTSDPAA